MVDDDRFRAATNQLLGEGMLPQRDFWHTIELCWLGIKIFFLKIG